ncbi:MAG TPA: PEP-CTERM sorting domain-containing protein [Woeseiaceae bacterium]|nr:PEP-CTERM sorting domain-containing protein [Woeseiaceae bacterium]
MKIRRNVTCALLFTLVPLTGHAVIIIDDTTTGLYNDGLGDLAGLDGPGGFLLGPNVSEGDPNRPPVIPDPGLTFSAEFGTDWLGGDYTGGTWSAGPVAIPGSWAVNTESAIVYDFTLDSRSDIHIDLGVDNGVLVWLNGSYLFGAQAGGGSSLTEYDLDISGLSAGTHSLQILREDHGGLTGFDILADAVAVPEPSALSLLGVSLLGLALLRRRQPA